MGLLPKRSGGNVTSDRHQCTTARFCVAANRIKKASERLSPSRYNDGHWMTAKHALDAANDVETTASSTRSPCSIHARYRTRNRRRSERYQTRRIVTWMTLSEVVN